MIVGVMNLSHWNRSRNSNIYLSLPAPQRTNTPPPAWPPPNRPKAKAPGERNRRTPVNTRHARRHVEIASNNGHNRAFLTAIPNMTLTFEDFPPGHFGTFGPRRVTREEIIAFAAEFDPQPMHLDDEAASRSMLKGLSGSGWHLCAIMMRMMFDGYIGRTASLGSPGVNELRWLAPVRPGDDLTID